MKKKEVIYNVLSTKLEMEDKKAWESITKELSTLRVYPLYSPRLFDLLDEITDSFENTILELVKKIMNDQLDSINNILDQRVWINKIYIDLIKYEIMDDIKNEIYYLVKLLGLTKNYNRIEGNLVSYAKGQAIVFNQDNTVAHIKRKKLLLSVLFFIFKENNSKWLEEYFKLNKELFGARKLDKQIPDKDNQIADKDNPEFYIMAALNYGKQMRAKNKRSYFSPFSDYIDVAPSTLRDNLTKLKILERIISILKNDG